MPVVIGVAAAGGVHDPTQDDGEEHERDESADQRPVHGGKDIRAKRGARPARWARGRPRPPGAAVPGGTRSAAGWAGAGRRGGRGETSRTVPWPSPRRDDSDERSSSRSSASPLSYARLPCLTGHPVHVDAQLEETRIKADFSPSVQRRFSENAGTSSARKDLQTAGCSEGRRELIAISVAFRRDGRPTPPGPDLARRL